METSSMLWASILWLLCQVWGGFKIYVQDLNMISLVLLKSFLLSDPTLLVWPDPGAKGNGK